ncbi:MAG: cytochrome P450 [Rhodobacterales bacterium]|nr:cytochrome P450 [Rhodobacterales bacterium]
MTTTEPDIRDFDLQAVPGDFIADPYRYFAALREHSPVHRLPDGSVMLTRYDDLCAVYRDPDGWRSGKKADFAPKFGPGSPLYEHHTTSVVFTDPPDHRRIRNLFQAAFTRKALEALRPRIAELVDGYLDAAEDRGGMDVVEDFSFTLPIAVICQMLGLPPEDRVLIRDWAVAILTALEPKLTPEQLDTGNRAVTDFKAYLTDLIAHRKAHPTDGADGEVLTALMEAEEDGRKLSELELLHQCIFMLNAGHETSTNMISHGVHEMLRRPDQVARLHTDPGLITTMVEEVLRFQAPIQINNRRAARDAVVGGVDLPEGTVVHLMIGAANHDPAQFAAPEQFDIGRQPNRHLSFGLGIHICAGNTLGRIEGEIAFGKLFARFPNLRLTGPAKLANRIRFREVTELPVAV